MSTGVKIPLYGKILLWFFLNVIVLGVIFGIVAHGQFNFGLEALMAGPAGERMDAVTQLLTGELRTHHPDQWNVDLQSYSDAYHVTFYLFHNGEEIAGAPVTVPPEVYKRMTERPFMNPQPHFAARSNRAR